MSVPIADKPKKIKSTKLWIIIISLIGIYIALGYGIYNGKDSIIELAIGGLVTLALIYNSVKGLQNMSYIKHNNTGNNSDVGL